MSDKEIISWIASSLVSFEIGLCGATLQFIDDEGVTCSMTVPRLNDEVTEEELLRECIQQANGLARYE